MVLEALGFPSVRAVRVCVHLEVSLLALDHLLGLALHERQVRVEDQVFVLSVESQLEAFLSEASNIFLSENPPRELDPLVQIGEVAFSDV